MGDIINDTCTVFHYFICKQRKLHFLPLIITLHKIDYAATKITHLKLFFHVCTHIIKYIIPNLFVSIKIKKFND